MEGRLSYRFVERDEGPEGAGNGRSVQLRHGNKDEHKADGVCEAEPGHRY